MSALLSFRTVVRSYGSTCAEVERVYDDWLASGAASELQRLNSPARGGTHLRARARTPDGDASVLAVAKDGDALIGVDATEELPDGLQLRAPRVMVALADTLPLADAGLRVEAHAELVDGGGADGLAAHISSSDRELPVVVITRNTREPEDPWLERAEHLARAFAGAAVVVTLTPEAVPPISRALGNYLWVSGGALRTYLPGVRADLTKEAAYELAPVLPHHRARAPKCPAPSQPLRWTPRVRSYATTRLHHPRCSPEG